MRVTKGAIKGTALARLAAVTEILQGMNPVASQGGSRQNNGFRVNRNRSSNTQVQGGQAQVGKVKYQDSKLTAEQKQSIAELIQRNSGELVDKAIRDSNE